MLNILSSLDFHSDLSHNNGFFYQGYSSELNLFGAYFV